MSALTRLFLWLGLLASTGAVALAAPASAATFPRELSTYAQSPAAGLWSVLQARVAAEPFNLAATAIFICAVLHTFLAPKISQWGHLVEKRLNLLVNFSTRPAVSTMRFSPVKAGCESMVTSRTITK